MIILDIIGICLLGVHFSAILWADTFFNWLLKK